MDSTGHGGPRRRSGAWLWSQPDRADWQGFGYNAYRVRTSTNPYIAPGATLTAMGKRHKLSTTQNHWAMEGRPIIREANLKQYQDNPNFAKGMNMPEPPGHANSSTSRQSQPRRWPFHRLTKSNGMKSNPFGRSSALKATATYTRALIRDRSGISLTVTADHTGTK